MFDPTSFELSDLPNAENDEFEFKSSKTLLPELNKKVACAVSGFGNSGGGCFVAGIDASGNADGGYPKKTGRQDLRDWFDQVIHQVEPVPPYKIKLIDNPSGRGSIDPDCSVLAIFVGDSHTGPHMAQDKKYYIRAGAHTVAARHFIVDAIFAKRHVTKPRLAHVFRTKPSFQQAIQLGIVALTSAPAIDVSISLSPLGEFLRNAADAFPLQIPVIDRDNPFFLDVTSMYMAEKRFGDNVQLIVTYKDLADNPYTYKVPVRISGSFGPVTIGTDPQEKMAKSLESIEKFLTKK